MPGIIEVAACRTVENALDVPYYPMMQDLNVKLNQMRSLVSARRERKALGHATSVGIPRSKKKLLVDSLEAPFGFIIKHPTSLTTIMAGDKT